MADIYDFFHSSAIVQLKASQQLDFPLALSQLDRQNRPHNINAASYTAWAGKRREKIDIEIES